MIVTQNSSVVNPAGRDVATTIFGDKVTFIGGGRDTILPNMPDNYGNHAEAKGVNYLIQNNIPTEGVKQFSSHNSCPSCETVQKSNGIYNGTGLESELGTQKRLLNPFEH